MRLDIIQAIAGRPWAIQAEIAAHVQGFIERDGIAGLRSLVGLKHDIHAFDGPRRGRSSKRKEARAVAVIPVHGPLTHHGNIVGSTETRSAAAIADEATAAAEDSRVGSIFLDINSPGGEVFGIPEAWMALREARKRKPIIAVANALAASAAYYLASAADELWVTPSGEVGSVGVYCLHIDESKKLEASGEKWTFVYAGRFKVEGNPAEPLSAEGVADMQSYVDHHYRMFVSAVARGRRVSENTVRKEFGEGRTVTAWHAVNAGMADKVGTFDQALARAVQLGGLDGYDALSDSRRHRATLEAEADARDFAERTQAARKVFALSSTGLEAHAAEEKAQAAAAALRLLSEL